MSAATPWRFRDLKEWHAAIATMGLPTAQGLYLPPFNITSYPDGHFCSNHACASECEGCRECRTSARVLFLHTEKTGGSSVECATQRTLVPAGLWTNMGHTSMEAVQRCISACPRRETIIVLSVREPYAFWQSAYRYTVQTIRSSWHPPTWAKANLTAFVAWAAHDVTRAAIESHQRSNAPQIKSQTAFVQRAC